MELSNNPSALTESLIGEYHGEMGLSQFRIGVNYFRLLIKLRSKNNTYIVMFLFACVLFLVIKDTEKAHIMVVQEFRNLSSFFHSPYSDSPSDFMFYTHAEYYIAANDNNFTRFFLNSYMDPKNKVIKEFTTEGAISNRIGELEKNYSIGFSFSNNVLTNGSLIRIKFIKSESTIFNSLYMNHIMDGILAYRNINVKTKIYHHPIQQPKSFPEYYIGMGISIISNFCYILLIWSFVLQIIELQEQKLHLLLKISGVHENTIWITTILFDSGIFLIFALYQSICMYFFEFSKGSSISLLTIFFFLVIESLYFFEICFTLILEKAKYFKYIISFLIGSAIILPIYQLNLRENANRGFLGFLIVFFPNSAMSYIIQNIAYLCSLNKTMNWFNFEHSMIMDSNVVLFYLFVSLITYLGIFFMIVLLKNRDIGTAPIGWRNMFCLNAWKSIFVKNTSHGFNEYDSKFIEVKDISKTFHGQITTRALDSISFEIEKGESIILIGPNGSGKSTLLNTMTGTISSDGGILYVNGKRAEIGFSALQDMIGICFQDNVFFPSLTVKDHLFFFASIRGQGTEETYSQIDSLLSGLNLSESKHRAAGQLSGGQKRKLCIALAFIGSPQLVILDEPTAGVDPNARQTIWKAISQFKGCTSLISSHSLEEAETIASRLFVMKNGNMAFMGTSTELRRQYKCGYRISLIGDNPNIDLLLEHTNQFIPESSKDTDRNDSILVPIDDRFVSLIEDIEPQLSLYNATSINITIEGLEHVLLRLIDN